MIGGRTHAPALLSRIGIHLDCERDPVYGKCPLLCEGGVHDSIKHSLFGSSPGCRSASTPVPSLPARARFRLSGWAAGAERAQKQLTADEEESQGKVEALQGCLKALQVPCG